MREQRAEFLEARLARSWSNAVSSPASIGSEMVSASPTTELSEWIGGNDVREGAGDTGGDW